MFINCNLLVIFFLNDFTGRAIQHVTDRRAHPNQMEIPSEASDGQADSSGRSEDS